MFLQIIYITEGYAFDNQNVKQFLDSREMDWPRWNLPHLKYSDISKDLIYPDWFEGKWIISSQDLEDNLNEKIVYEVNFFKNELGEVVGDRSSNSEAVGKAIFGDRLKKVRNDPQSFNNQITYLIDNEYIESRITERSQIYDNDLFFADEFVIQTVHKPEASRINQVEVMSKFYKCKFDDKKIEADSKNDICGIQYIATYGSKVGIQTVEAITTNKFSLRFKPIENLH